MSRWDDILGGKKQEEPLEQMTVEGSFICQVCGALVDKGVYLPHNQILTWKCEDGHKSFIEKFKI